MFAGEPTEGAHLAARNLAEVLVQVRAFLTGEEG